MEFLKIKVALGLSIIMMTSCQSKQQNEMSESENNSEMEVGAYIPAKDTVVLIHAAWLGAWEWEAVSKKLEEKGLVVISPDLPGHGQDKTQAKDISMELYVQTVLNILDKQTKPVVLVGHSFNGITISRVAELRPGKVKKLVYVTAFLLPNGMSFLDAVSNVQGSVAVDNFYLSEDKQTALVKSDEIQNAFAQDVPKKDFEAAMPNIVPEPAGPLGYKLEVSEENYGRIPKYYIECTKDNAIPIESQRAMYTGKVKRVYTLASGHTPNFSHPDELAQAIVEIEAEE